MPRLAVDEAEELLKRRMLLEIEARGWSESKFAAALGVRQTKLWTWLHGNNSAIRYGDAINIASLLGVTMDDLMNPTRTPRVEECPHCRGMGKVVIYDD